MPGLTHPLLEMREVELRMTGREPDEIVPVPALDPALPFPAQNGVHFPGKEVGQAKRPDGEGDRPQEI